MTFSKLYLQALALSAVLCTGQESSPLVSKSVTRVFSVADRVFAFGDSGKAFSRLDLFVDPPVVRNGSWPYPGGVEGGAPWKQSLVLHGNAWRSDSVRVARVASLFYDGIAWKPDTMVFPIPRTSANPFVRGAGLTAVALWRDTVILGFGRLGLAMATLAPENDPKLFSTTSVAFFALPTGRDSTLPTIACAWGQTCRVDTLQAPVGGVDSVISLAVDSSASDSVWLLVATQSGLRRGLLGSRAFPRVRLPGIADTAKIAVQRLAVTPERRLLWAFTGADVYFSDNHGASFRDPPDIPGLQTKSSDLTAFASTPKVAFFGESTFVNFNFYRPGLVAFRRDSLQRNQGAGAIADVLIDSEDSLGLTQGEGSLTELAVARRGNEAILAVGSTAKGLFYRKLSASSGKAFANLNRLRGVKGSLGEVITYPTLFTGETVNGIPEQVQLGYRLKKDGKVTITVFNYAMEKVRTVVKSAPRRGGGARSENPAEDRWDGKDTSGRRVSVGTYYILVESDQGERGFGKALVVRGVR